MEPDNDNAQSNLVLFSITNRYDVPTDTGGFVPTPEIRAFLTIAQGGSSSPRAARELHLTQPAVSAQLKRLEDDVGTWSSSTGPPREWSSPRPGRCSGATPRRPPPGSRTGSQALAGLAALQQGSLAIGAGATATTYLLPARIRCLPRGSSGDSAHGPRAGLGRGGRWRAVSGELDLGIVTVSRSPTTEAWSSPPGATTSCCLIVPPDHAAVRGCSHFRWRRPRRPAPDPLRGREPPFVG